MASSEAGSMEGSSSLASDSEPDSDGIGELPSSVGGGRSSSKLKRGSSTGWTSSGELQAMIQVQGKRIKKLEAAVKAIKQQELGTKLHMREQMSVFKKVEENLEKQRAGVEEVEQKLDEKIGQLGSDMQNVRGDVQGVATTVRDEWQSLENAISTARKAVVKVEKLGGSLSETKGDVDTQFERFASSLRFLGSELQMMRMTSSSLQNEMHEQRSSGGRFSQVDEHSVLEMFRRLEDSLMSQQRLLVSQQMLEKQIKACVRKDELSEMNRAVGEMQSREQSLRKYVSEQMLAANKDKAKQVVEAWMFKKTTATRLETCRSMFDAWGEYMEKRYRAREALGRTQHQYAKAHVSEWCRSWWYIMQRETADRQFNAIREDASNQSVQIEMLLASMHRHEKTTTEQAKQLNHRLHTLEKGLEDIERRKSDKTAVAEAFEALEARLNWQADLKEVRDSIQANSDGIRKLEMTKFSEEQGKECQAKIQMLTREMRNSFQQHEERLDLCADLESMAQKADAKLVEEVCVLLAQQADQLANLLASDLAQIRKAMTRFLELSPDIRKAALSVGIETNEQCVSCRAIRRKLVQDIGIGADNRTYKLEPGEAVPEQAAKILSEKLGFPTALASSLAAGATVTMHSQGPEMTQLLAQAGGQTSAQQPLRRLLASPTGWLSRGGRRPPQSVAPSASEVSPGHQSSAPGGGRSSAMGFSDDLGFQEAAVPKSFFPAVPGADRGSGAVAARPGSSSSRPRSGRSSAGGTSESVGGDGTASSGSGSQVRSARSSLRASRGGCG